jgi:parallel beta-helix repeat protein
MRCHNAGGFVVHHNFDGWRGSAPINNSNHGIYIYGDSGYSNITNNTVYSNYGNGFRIYEYPPAPACYHDFTNNTAYLNSLHGFSFGYTHDNNLTGNIIHSNTHSGVYLNSDAPNHTFMNNTLYNNSQYGIHLNNSNNITFANNTLYSNTLYGIYLVNSTSNTFTNTLFYNNGYDFVANATDLLSYNMTNSTFTNPSGTLENYTSLSINDTVTASSSYSINWTSSPGTPFSSHLSFAQKFINISTASGTPSRT